VNLEKPQAQPLEWWRTQPQRRLTLEEIAALPGVTIPLDKPGPSDEEAQQDQAPDGQSPKDGDGASPDDSAASKDAEKSQARRGWLRRAAPASRRVRRRSVLGGLGGAVIEMLAALALLSGAVLGSWWALLIGWAMAYYSRRLSPSEAKFASLGLPGTVLVGTLVWLWGRIEGRWGEPLAQGQLRAAISDAFPWMVRIAAVGSALFILWRSRTRTAD
jgi:hypothetical protein